MLSLKKNDFDNDKVMVYEDQEDAKQESIDIINPTYLNTVISLGTEFLRCNCLAACSPCRHTALQR